MKGFDLSKLRINPNNPYPFSGSDTEWADFKKKLDRDPEFMEANKIAFDSSRDNLIIAGNKRVQALRELGWKMIPDKYVIDCKDWSEEKRERYIYASNWNIGQWSMEFTSEEQAEEWGITFDEEEEVHLEAQEDGYLPPAEIQTDIVRGDLFELKKGDLCHRLLCGDSTSVDDMDKLMDGAKADMVFTDPPYGVSIGKKNQFLNSFQPSERNLNEIVDDEKDPQELKTILTQAFSLLKENSAEHCSYYVTAPQGGDLWMMMMMMSDSGIPVRHILNWVKNQQTFSMGRLDYEYKHEPILYTWNKKHFFYGNGNFKNSCWEIDKPRASKEHPTMKPVELVENAILNSSQTGDLVVDIYGGSGTTLIAAHQLNRNCNIIEITENYTQVIIDRMLKLDDEIQLFRNGKDVTEKYRERLLASEKQA